MIYVFLANGFEEIEALATVDFLRRCELDVKTVAVSETRSRFITGAHRMTVQADITQAEVQMNADVDAIVLPGGMPGTLNLEKSQTVRDAITYAMQNNILTAAICAAPSILGHMGYLEGKRAVCFPGFEEQLLGAAVVENGVCEDGIIITGKGAGVTIAFAKTIAEKLIGEVKPGRVYLSMQCMLS